MMMIPEAWEKHEGTTMDERRRAFCEYHASMLEPWTARRRWFTDSRSAPRSTATAAPGARYIVTDDDLVVMRVRIRRAADPRAPASSKSGACSRARCS